MNLNLIRPAHSKKFLLVSIAVALISILFFFVRLWPYVERPTAGFISYYTAGKFLLNDYDMDTLYDQEKFHDSIPVLTNYKVEDVYGPNPPTLAILFLPLAFLSAVQGKIIWEIASLLCVIASLLLLKQQFKMSKIESVTVIAFTFACTPLYINFVYGQFYAFMLFLHVAMFVLWQNRKMFLASIAIALMLSLKGYGAMFLIVALAMKEWRLFGYSIMNYFLVLLSSSFVVGFKTLVIYFETLRNLFGTDPYAATFQQTVQSVIARLFQQDQWNFNPLIQLPAIVQPMIMILFISAIAALIVISRNQPRTEITIPVCCAIIIGIIFAPRVGGDYHYAMLLMPLVFVFVEIYRNPNGADIAGFTPALFLLSAKIPYHSMVFQTTWFGMLGFPRIYGSLILLWLLFRLARKRKQEPNTDMSFLRVVQN